MTAHLEWHDIAWRLLLTVLGAGLLGINREEHGRAAGLRTMLLVGLAACVSMIQVNLLLPIKGKASDSFVVMDLMRLPLGILSGMGFIGAGAILRKDTLVMGVTTAATLWFDTVLGLCFGGGQLALGSVALALGLIVLWLLKPVEGLWKQDRQASLIVVVKVPGMNEKDVTEAVRRAGGKVTSLAVVHDKTAARREIHCTVEWRGRPGQTAPPDFVAELAKAEQAVKVVWQPQKSDPISTPQTSLASSSALLP